MKHMIVFKRSEIALIVFIAIILDIMQFVIYYKFGI